MVRENTWNFRKKVIIVWDASGWNLLLEKIIFRNLPEQKIFNVMILKAKKFQLRIYTGTENPFYKFLFGLRQLVLYSHYVARKYFLISRQILPWLLASRFDMQCDLIFGESWQNGLLLWKWKPKLSACSLGVTCRALIINNSEETLGLDPKE